MSVNFDFSFWLGGGSDFIGCKCYEFEWWVVIFLKSLKKWVIGRDDVWSWIVVEFRNGGEWFYWYGEEKFVLLVECGIEKCKVGGWFYVNE